MAQARFDTLEGATTVQIIPCPDIEGVVVPETDDRWTDVEIAKPLRHDPTYQRALARATRKLFVEAQPETN